MPTDETTLARLAETWEERARRFAASAEDSESSSDIERYRAAPLYRRAAAEARLIADALRFRLAALTAPAESAAEIAALKADGERFALPAEMQRMYDHAADKAVSVGALKMLKHAEAAIGRWYMQQRDAARASEPRGRE